MRFALNIWSLIENCVAFSSQVHEKVSLDQFMSTATYWLQHLCGANIFAAGAS